MRYTYRCPIHGEFDQDLRADAALCGWFEGNRLCRREAKRVWSWHNDTSFEPYYAPSFGQVVNSRSHAQDLAKITSEETTLRTGIETHYEVVDTHDDAAVGIDTAEKEAEKENTRRFAVNGAVWSAERRAEIAAEKAKVTEDRKAKVEVDA